jgi:hypothetical protein
VICVRTLRRYSNLGSTPAVPATTRTNAAFKNAVAWKVGRYGTLGATATPIPRPTPSQGSVATVDLRYLRSTSPPAGTRCSPPGSPCARCTSVSPCPACRPSNGRSRRHPTPHASVCPSWSDRSGPAGTDRPPPSMAWSWNRVTRRPHACGRQPESQRRHLHETTIASAAPLRATRRRRRAIPRLTTSASLCRPCSDVHGGGRFLHQEIPAVVQRDCDALLARESPHRNLSRATFGWLMTPRKMRCIRHALASRTQGHTVATRLVESSRRNRPFATRPQCRARERDGHAIVWLARVLAPALAPVLAPVLATHFRNTRLCG